MKKFAQVATMDQPIAANEMKAPVKLKSDWYHDDLVLNVGFQETMIRGFISIFIPLPLLFIDHVLMIWAAPVMFYLFVTALTHFCFVRYVWQHMIHHYAVPEKCDFAIELDIPVKTI